MWSKKGMYIFRIKLNVFIWVVGLIIRVDFKSFEVEFEKAPTRVKEVYKSYMKFDENEMETLEKYF